MKDPICGMEGIIPAHGHKFCSQHCIREYEKKKNLSPPMMIRFSWMVYPIGIIFSGLLIWVLQANNIMIPFMGAVFLVLSFLKFLDIKGFAKAFAKYDIIAARSNLYGMTYPFIEFSLGLMYVLNYEIQTAAIITFLIMSVGLIGVTKNILREKPLKCACLGTKIKIPLTKFTFFEDLSMAVMALMLLFPQYFMFLMF